MQTPDWILQEKIDHTLAERFVREVNLPGIDVNRALPETFQLEKKPLHRSAGTLYIVSVLHVRTIALYVDDEGCFKQFITYSPEFRDGISDLMKILHEALRAAKKSIMDAVTAETGMTAGHIMGHIVQHMARAEKAAGE